MDAANVAVRTLIRALLTTRRKTYALDAAARLAAAGRAPRMPVEFRSQMGEDMLLWDLLDWKLDGFYIEVGAFDGRKFSASYAFDAMGWNGLLVEPTPARFEACRINRPNARCVHAALSCRGSQGFTNMQVTDDHWGGMLSYMPGSLSPIQAAELEKERCVEVRVQVPLTTMDDLLRDHTGPIDFAVIDVEGHEEMLLDGFDVERFRPRLLLVEDVSYGQNRSLREMLARRGYVPRHLHDFNVLFAREEDTEMVQRLQEVAYS